MSLMVSPSPWNQSRNTKNGQAVSKQSAICQFNPLIDPGGSTRVEEKIKTSKQKLPGCLSSTHPYKYPIANDHNFTHIDGGWNGIGPSTNNGQRYKRQSRNTSNNPMSFTFSQIDPYNNSYFPKSHWADPLPSQKWTAPILYMWNLYTK